MSAILEVVKKKDRTLIKTNRMWEDIVGYSRAVKKGNWITVTGTLGFKEDGSIGDGPGEQTRDSLLLISKTLEALGASMADVIRTRIYITDFSKWEEIGRAHAEFFGEIRPATTMVQISALADPKAWVEIEVEAITGD